MLLPKASKFNKVLASDEFVNTAKSRDKCIFITFLGYVALFCLQFLIQAHDFEGSSSDFLVHNEHEGRRQYRL